MRVGETADLFCESSSPYKASKTLKVVNQKLGPPIMALEPFQSPESTGFEDFLPKTPRYSVVLPRDDEAHFLCFYTFVNAT